MSKKRTSLNDFAIPVPGIRTRRPITERIRIEGARDGARSASQEADDAAKFAAPVNGLAHSSNGTIVTTSVARSLSKEELATLEDAELLTRFQDGDERAFYTLFDRRQKEIYTHCFRMCSRDAEMANDAFQDTFVKVFTRKALFTDATNGRAWLYRIATNTCLNSIRYNKRHPREALGEYLSSSDPQLQPDFSTEQDSLRESLETAMSALPIELREPFLLREIEEFSYEDAAAQLGITVPACRQRVYRAKQLLREALEDLAPGSGKKKDA